jgi:putative hydrolase of the HAD superfamily
VTVASPSLKETRIPTGPEKLPPLRAARDRVVVWDFDGTLAERPGMWRESMKDVLDEHEPGHAVTSEMLRPFLRSGFPWDIPDVHHPELRDPNAWWAHVEHLLVRGYEGVGIVPARARALAVRVRERYVDPRYWRVFDDTLPALTHFRELGWRHLILSNHVPELETIVDHLGLGSLVDGVVNSAETGYEKPHPEAFAHARRAAGEAEQIWMVGDNKDADVAGAERVGIPAILVRRDGERVPGIARQVKTLADVLEYLEGGR